MKSSYSIAICPPDSIVSEVKLLKQELESKVGKFPSRNSEAHLTFNVFKADEAETAVWKKFLSEFCRNLAPFEIVFDKTGSNARAAFYLTPDQGTLERLVPVMKKFYSELPYPFDEPFPDPHMSIGRRLKPQQLETAFSLFSEREIQIKFTCDNLAMRKYNPAIGQYEILQRFKFAAESHSRIM